MKKAIIFDFDGTLHWNAELLSALRHVFLETVSNCTGEAVENIENELRQYRLMNNAAGELGFLLDRGVPLSRWFDAAESLSAQAKKNRLTDDVCGFLLDYSDQVHLAIASNSPWKLLNTILVASRVEHVFSLIACPRHPSPVIHFPCRGKPSASLYAGILKKLGVSARDALAVGDRFSIDIQPAQKIGMRTLLVDKGDLVEKLYLEHEFLCE